MSWEQILLIAREVRAIVQWRRFIEHVARMHIDSVEALIYAIDVPSLLSICNDEAERIK